MIKYTFVSIYCLHARNNLFLIFTFFVKKGERSADHVERMIFVVEGGVQMSKKKPEEHKRLW